MAQNPYYIQPANFMPGINAMMQGAIAGGEEQQKRDALTEFSQNFQNMTPMEIAQYTLEHPEVAQQITQATEMNLKMSKEENLQQAWDVITGKKDPSKALLTRAEEIIARGGDATETIDLAYDALQGGDKALKTAYAYVASNDPAGFKAYMDATSPETLESTTDIKNWKKFQELLDKDPDQAQQFGIAAGFIEPDSYSQTTEDRYVEDVSLAYEQKHGKPMPPDLRAKARLEHKRAQAGEVAANQWAKRNVDAATAEQISFNEKLGSRLAEIQTQKELMAAKGEVSPVEKQQQAKGRMTGNLSRMTRHYLDLDSMGAILNVQNPTMDNLLAAAKSSGLGQFIGKITGSEAQSIRNKIKKLKPLLIQDIRQSTDMGARGLDSEKELEFYLQAATDEKTDVQSNLAAIAVLDEAFGNGEIAQELAGAVDPEEVRRIRLAGEQILNGTPLVQTQQEYDKLKSGQLYLERDENGNIRQYRKP